MNDALYERFKNPPSEYGSIPKWIWNTDIHSITEDEIRKQFKGFKENDGYTGVMIVLWNNGRYLDDLFFEKYETALRVAGETGLEIIIWDENGFPSGHAGGLMEKLYPQHMAKRLDMLCETAYGGTKYSSVLPDGDFMGAVIMNTETFERVDISECVSDGLLIYNIPDGESEWKLMIFTIVTDEPCGLAFSKSRLIDYLSEDAVNAFINITHQAYYDRFSEYFGSVIKYAFYDEPAFWHITGGRIWTGNFNDKFMDIYGCNPILLYPALFMDIGSDTASARNMLHAFRSELYAECYVKTLNIWCNEHKIQLTGHMDQEEILSPVSISGDLMKVFEYQDIPGVDQIAQYGRASSAYKIVSSAANNYDKPAVMCEVFGAMGEDMPVKNLLKEAMDQFAKGINFVVPHGTWYDNEKNVVFPPELSFRSKKFAESLSVYNDYVKRSSSILRGGIHVSDIAILYPIADLNAYYRFGDENPYLGGNIAPHVNYTEIGEVLSLDLRKDFTYLHPDVLNEKCSVKDKRLILNNTENREEYNVFILPAIETIHAENLEKLRGFAMNGGTLISVGRLPAKSAEYGNGKDNKVVEMIESLFNTTVNDEDYNYTVRKHKNGGQCYYLPTFTADILDAVLADSGIIFDVECPRITIDGGNFTWIHKIIDNRDVYFFANSGDQSISVHVKLRGTKDLELWNPHTTERKNAEYRLNQDGTMSLLVELEPVQSVFFTGNNK